MRTVEIEQVRVAYRYEWKAWPNGKESYDSIVAGRSEFIVEKDDVRFVVRERIYPVHLAFVRAGETQLPVIPGDINNTKLPSQRVIDQYVADLEALAADGCTSIVWEHAMNCYPEVAVHLQRLFRLVILTFGDDCPGSSEIKTFPVAANFDAYIHNMFIWDGATGERTGVKYNALGLPYCCFQPMNETVGIERFIKDSEFSVEDKIADLEAGKASPFLVFVGAGFGDSRMNLIYALGHRRQQLAAEGIVVKLLGYQMPDGPVQPFRPMHPLGLGYPIGGIYASAAWGFNVPISSIFNCRLVDLIRMGVLQFIHDKHGELAECGFLADVHYAAYDGTSSGLVERVRCAKADLAGSAKIARAALARLVDFKRETHRDKIYADIYGAHLGQLEGGARQKVWRAR